MYEFHFGLTPRPFGESTRPETFISLPSREAALRRLRFGLEHAGGPALLFGPSGSGKTLLARSLAHQLNWTPTHLTFPAMPAADFLAYLADELHAPPGTSDVAGSLRRIKDFLRNIAHRGSRHLLIVDEAHLIDDPAVFETLRLLLTDTDTGVPSLSLLLVGGPEILLNLPASLMDRLTARCLLPPLTFDESVLYLTGKMSAAGAARPVFDEDSLQELYLGADGMPRRINRIADLALLIASADEKERVGAMDVEIALAEAAFEPLGV